MIGPRILLIFLNLRRKIHVLETSTINKLMFRPGHSTGVFSIDVANCLISSHFRCAVCSSERSPLSCSSRASFSWIRFTEFIHEVYSSFVTMSGGWFTTSWAVSPPGVDTFPARRDSRSLVTLAAPQSPPGVVVFPVCPSGDGLLNLGRFFHPCPMFCHNPRLVSELLNTHRTPQTVAAYAIFIT